METYIIIAIIVILVILSRSSKFRGFQGEQKVKRKLNKLPDDQYIVLNDVILRTAKGSTQIDHVVVSIYGIFVIETKNYTGWISGSEFGEKWTKNMYGNKYDFYNPLRQNYAHMKALEEKLSINENNFIPIVAFSNRCTLKVNTQQPVIYISHLLSEIDRYKDYKVGPDEIKGISERILALNTSSQDLRSGHTEIIRENVREDNRKISQGICPKCSGQLVRRSGKYGSFYGCSNYPKCRYTKKI
ncbi:hypothetical protein MASR2M70_00470 [Bacillota bacterium]